MFSLFILSAFAQVGTDYDLVKPKKWENRTLASETSNDGKKFKKSRHFIQNTITHYNYYFNANEKVKLILARAKSQFREDYTRLLPFYNYTLEATASQKKDLDSVIYKCTMGILIHDTRNDWIDNLYLLIGETYYYKKFFDSAYITLQFLNYAFAPREKDGYPIPIGSNYNHDEGGSANIVSTLEKPNVLQKAFSLPPSRNESLIWKIRNYIAAEQYTDAASLIQILTIDPQFPHRLQPSLQEVKALYFYKQQVYDSAAIYLEKALPAAGNQEEVARWEYLIAQLYEKLNRSYEAKTFYERVVAHTYNPILDIYARLNAIRQNKEGGEDYIARNIQALVKMARKDRYETYKDIIYYTAAQMELERKNKPGAVAFLRMCIKASAPNGTQRNKAFLQLGNLSLEDKDYRLAKSSYDSLNLISLASEGDISWLPDRTAALATIVSQLDVIARQDSLQRIAAMPAAQRDALLKKMAKALRKAQGLRDDNEIDGGSSNANTQNNQIPDLFSAGASANANDWYFNNANLRAKGYSDFKTRWGNRPNVDNWQVSSIMKNSLQAAAGTNRNPDALTPDGQTKGAAPAGIDYKSLLANLPLTPPKMKKSMDSVEKALFLLAKTYQEGIPDYLYAINTYDSLLTKFPETALREQTYFSLYYCYKKLGDEANAARMLELMKQKFPNGASTAKLVNPDSAEAAGSRVRVNATHQYEKIYTDFIEGRFDEALAQKKIADSLYGDKYWTPQLLYIESVYFIRSRQDQQAKVILTNIINKYPKTPMAEKATTMLDVLSRRRQIEDYLTRLQVTKAADDDTVNMLSTPPAAKAPDNRPRLVRNDSNMLKKEDTSQLARAKLHLPAAPGVQGQKPSVAAPGMDKLKVDPASLQKISMDAGQLANLQRQQDSLATALLKAKADSQQTALLHHMADSVQAVMRQLQADTAQLAARLRTLNSAFSFTPTGPHSVVIVMNKVDPVYVSEAKNAFNGYNQENFYSQSLTADNASLSDSLKLLVISGFPTDKDALDYLQHAKALAPRQIVPWLPADKYTFMIISGANLRILLTGKDMSAYRQFLSAAYPGKF
jgi:tetratricopeptide (TPR) repeat protein